MGEDGREQQKKIKKDNGWARPTIEGTRGGDGGGMMDRVPYTAICPQMLGICV